MSQRRIKSLIDTLKQQGIHQNDVLQAIETIPRELFLPSVLTHRAYENNALPIGQGQTISQPYIVALMTQLLLEKVDSSCSVLEIGTGSGYQTAILSSIFHKVYSVERIKKLQFQARQKLNKLDLHNVKMKHADGWQGWSSKAPFDAIIVTAAPNQVPNSLIEQLSDNSRMVIPVGELEQTLYCIDKHEGLTTTKKLDPVNFVPLIEGAIL